MKQCNYSAVALFESSMVFRPLECRLTWHVHNAVATDRRLCYPGDQYCQRAWITAE